MKPPEFTDEQYRAAAKRMYEDEGTLEIDDNAIVNSVVGDEGAYVQAWVWVYDNEVELVNESKEV